MKTLAFYVVRPKPAFHEMAREWPDDLREIFSETMGCASSEGGRSSWTNEDHTVKAKLIVLLQLHQDYSGNAEVDELFRDGVSLELFDRFWSIERFDTAASTDNFGSRLDDRFSRLVRRTGYPLVDAWAGTGE